VHSLRPVRVLLVSADGRFGRVTGFLLARSGFVVKLVRRANELVDAISEHSPSIVILDCGDSLVAGARQVAALEALYPDIAVVMVAGETENVSSSLRLIRKWCPFEELLAEVSHATRVSGAQLTPVLADG
jgi:DNA-binding response OmpR family regulator